MANTAISSIIMRGEKEDISRLYRDMVGLKYNEDRLVKILGDVPKDLCDGRSIYAGIEQIKKDEVKEGLYILNYSSNDPWEFNHKLHTAISEEYNLELFYNSWGDEDYEETKDTPNKDYFG